MNAPRRLLYLCGQIGMMGLTRYLFGWIIDFARTTEQGATVPLFSAAMIGVVFLVFRVFDGVTDPVAGLVSDRWVSKGKERRRLLWLAFALPPIGLALCFAPDHAMEPALRWTLMVAGLFIFFVGYTFYAIPYWSLIADYAGDDSGERRLLSTLLGVGLIVATGVGFVVGPLLVERYGFFSGALLFALPGLALMALPYFAQPSGGVLRSEREDAPSLLASLKLALGHRRFVAVLLLFSGSQMSFTILTAAAPFIAVDLLGGSRGDVALLLGPLLAMAVVGFSVVPMLSRRLGWERAMLLASLLLAVVYGLSAGLGRGIIGTPVTTAMVLFACGGPMTAVLLGLEGEAITSCAQERGGDVVSTYFGVFNFIVKALNGVALTIAGAMADLSQGDLGVTAVRLMSLIAGGCLLVCASVYFVVRPRKPRS